MEHHATHARTQDITTARLLGLAGFRVLAAGEVDGELEVLVETDAQVTGCRSCGVLATPHGRRATLVRDVPSRAVPRLRAPRHP